MASFKHNGKVFKHGDYISCKIEDTVIQQGQICYLDPDFSTAYICQNRMCGDVAPRLFGYRYSWSIEIREGVFQPYDVLDLKYACSKPRD